MEFNTQNECLIKVNHRNQQMFLRILLKWHRMTNSVYVFEDGRLQTVTNNWFHSFTYLNHRLF